MRLSSAVVLALVILATQAMACALDRSEPCRFIRGRLFVANGAPAIRIWKIGSKRILGVVAPDGGIADIGMLPGGVALMLKGREIDGRVYGDFRICPVTPARPGRMQMVSVTAARNLLVRNRAS